MATMNEMYQSVIIEHDRSPRNHRTLEAPTHRAEGRNPLCGDEVTLELVVDADGRIADVGFQGRGCAVSRASASMMTTAIQGKTVDEVMQIRNTQIVQDLSLPPVKIHCSVLAEDGIKAAIADWKKRREGDAEAKPEAKPAAAATR